MADDDNAAPVMDKAQAKTSLKQKFSSFINDVGTLDVLTLKGKVELVLPKSTDGGDGDDKGTFSWNDLLEQVVSGLETGENTVVQVGAYTHAEWDQDSVNYVADDASEALIAAHNKTVAASHESRLNALKFIAETLDSIFD